MSQALNRLAELQQRMLQSADAEMPPEYIERLSITDVAGHLHIDFYGDPFGESFASLLTTVALPEVSVDVASLIFRGPDEGANGTRNWDLGPLVAGPGSFPRLRYVSIEQTKPADHNRTIVAATYDEEGVLAQLLAKAPMLTSLITPSAPNADFFKIDNHRLAYLNVDAGYDHQGIIRNLAHSSCFPDLSCLEFGEYHETYMDDYLARCTPIGDYHELFRSPAFKSVGRFVWRNPACSNEEISALKALRPELQLLVLRTSAEYFRG